MEAVQKRKAEEKLEHHRQKVQIKQQVEKQSLEDFRWVATWSEHS